MGRRTRATGKFPTTKGGETKDQLERRNAIRQAPALEPVRADPPGKNFWDSFGEVPRSEWCHAASEIETSLKLNGWGLSGRLCVDRRPQDSLSLPALKKGWARRWRKR